MIDPKIVFFSDWATFCKCSIVTYGTEAGDLSQKIRRMILDGSSLVHMINRELKIKLHFPVSTEIREIYPGQKIFGALALGDFKEPILNGSEQMLRLDDFLQHTILEVDGVSLTVRETIKLVANNLGGVHFDAKGAQEVANFDFNDPQVIRAMTAAIVSIAKIISVAVRPLIKHCSPFPPYENFLGHYDNNPGTLAFEKKQWMEVEYPQGTNVGGFAYVAVLELSTQEISEAVLFSVENETGAFFILYVSPEGNLKLYVRWGDVEAELLWKDNRVIRPIGKKVLVRASANRRNNELVLILGVNGKENSACFGHVSKNVEIKRAVLGANSQGEHGASFYLQELCVLNDVEEATIQAIKKYSLYRYQL